MGGFLALDMASRRPRQLRDLTVISGAYYSVLDTVVEPWRSFRRTRSVWSAYTAMTALTHLGPLAGPLLELADRAGLMPFMLQKTAATPKHLRPSVTRSIASGLRPRAFRLAAQNAEGYRASERWGNIVVPTQALFGKADHLVTEVDERRLVHDNPAVRVIQIAQAGHYAPVEQPFEVLDALLGHWDIPSRSATSTRPR